MNLQHVQRAFRKNPVQVLFGCFICLTGCGLLIWNEGHAVRTAQSLSEGHELVVLVSHTDAINEENEGKVIHVSGQLSTFPALVDEDYNVKINAVRLKRRVQMFQWVEHADWVESSSPQPGEVPPSTDVQYHYTTEWKDKVIDHKAFNIPFGHENPEFLSLQTEIWTTKVVMVNPFYLSEKIMETFSTFEPFAGDEEPTSLGAKLHAGIYYHCKDIFNPKVGDIRVQFYYAGHAGDTFSLVGMQKNHTLEPYTSSNGQELVLLQPGQKSHEEMFAIHRSYTSLNNWLLRMLSYFILCAALSIMREFPFVVVSQFPLLRDLSAMSDGRFILVSAMSISLIIIALSWCIYRPLMALLLLTVSLLPALKATLLHRRR